MIPPTPDRAGAPTDSIAFQRPLLRGVLHLVAAVAATGGAAALLLIAHSPRTYVGAAIFAPSLILLYATSGAYHRITWGPLARRIMRRLDHSMIFVLIAGTYTPLALVLLSTAWLISILAVVWGIAGVGILAKMLWPNAPRWLSVLCYAALGWLAVLPAVNVVGWFTTGPLALLLIGGLMYTAGGVVYAGGKPNPFPRVFGYHEVFHALVIAGSALHYTLVAAYVLPSA